MSWLSSISGVHISKHGVKVEPLKALGTALTLGSFGALGPVGGIISKIPAVGGLAAKLGGAGAIGKIGAGIEKYAPLALGVGSAIEGYQQNKRAGDLQNEALNIARSDQAARAPLLKLGTQGLQTMQRPDLSSIYEDQGNPYMRRLPRVGGMR